ncbi:hypothetical protein ASPCAL04783 [Aspergillus calidoustus]|uniref:Rhodopsin domain-containing protein n=1 Tax=Aspergillus calidoustus TaxID=454130 RepID=A0A0U5G2C1_ASPCI|nr:hypothetical protein ASPCAL04783 [Aspergillus calidoustus]
MGDNIQTEALAIILLFPILSTVVIILRCYSRFLIRQFGWDDILIVIAWLLAVGQAYTVWIYTKLSYQGYHSWDIPEQTIDEQILAQRYNLANQLLYNPILAIVKASIIVFIYRLEDRRPVVRWNLHILFAVNLGLMIAIFLADLFQCTPLHYVYDYPRMDLVAQEAAGADENGMADGKVVKGGRCIHQVNFFLISAGMTILTDIWLLCIPTMVVWHLHMNRRKKIAIAGVLSMGVIVTVIGIARLVIYNDRFKPNKTDRTYNIGHTISSVEVNVAIITASATALTALINRIAPRLFPSSNSTSQGQRRMNTWTASSGTRNTTRRGRSRTSYVMMGNMNNKGPAHVSQEHIMVPEDRSSRSRTEVESQTST